MWFAALTGFNEHEVGDVATQFVIDGDQITSKANGRTMRCGVFEAVALSELRHRAASAEVTGRGGLRIREVIADVQDLHADPANAGAMFQVASQFNTLEMVSPSVTPEKGVADYDLDFTQGPACAIACGAGTIYRNYLVPLRGRIGQTVDNQIDCLADLVAELGADMHMENGYALPTEEQLAAVTDRLISPDIDRDQLMGSLQIGMQWHAEVTLENAGHLVTQAYCSAVPVAYSSLPETSWEPFARLVLDGAYEATLAAAVVNREMTDNRRVFLTMLGGGVFGNRSSWIVAAITRAAAKFADQNLDVAVVSHGSPNPELEQILS